MRHRGARRQYWLAVLAMTAASPLVAAPLVAAPPSSADIREAWNRCSRGHDLFRAGELAAAEFELHRAAILAPEWAAPQGVLGALYQQQAFAAGSRHCRLTDSGLVAQALAAYAAVQRAGSQELFTRPQAPPWVEAGQVLAPARGLLGGNPDSIMRAYRAREGERVNRVPRLAELLAAAFPAPLSAVRGGARGNLNPLPPGRVRPNNPYLGKQLKLRTELLAETGAVATWEVNQRRLESDVPVVVPDAYLVCLARAFGRWAIVSDTRQHKWREERFAKAFPQDHEQWNVKETLSWSDAQYGSFVLTVPSVQDTVYRLFKSPGHYEALIDRRMQFIGPACLPNHAGSYVLQVSVVGPFASSPKQRAGAVSP